MPPKKTTSSATKKKTSPAPKKKTPPATKKKTPPATKKKAPSATKKKAPSASASKKTASAKKKNPASENTRTVTHQVTTVTTVVSAPHVPKKTKSSSAIPRPANALVNLPSSWHVTRSTDPHRTSTAVGTYDDRGTAIGVAKRLVANACGLPFATVAKSRHLRVLADSDSAWDVLWTPPGMPCSRFSASQLPSAPIVTPSPVVPKRENKKESRTSQKPHPLPKPVKTITKRQKNPKKVPTASSANAKRAPHRKGNLASAVVLPAALVEEDNRPTFREGSVPVSLGAIRTAQKGANAASSRYMKSTARRTGTPATAAMPWTLAHDELPSPGDDSLLPHAFRTKQTARNPYLGSVPAPTSSTRKPVSKNAAWVVTKEAGYYPDGFHAPMPPRHTTVGVFESFVAAVTAGREQVGSEVGWSWDEVKESGDLEVVRDQGDEWEVCWKPPDSEYCRIKVAMTGVVKDVGGGRVKNEPAVTHRGGMMKRTARKSVGSSSGMVKRTARKSGGGITGFEVEDEEFTCMF